MALTKFCMTTWKLIFLTESSYILFVFFGICVFIPYGTAKYSNNPFVINTDFTTAVFLPERVGTSLVE